MATKVKQAPEAARRGALVIRAAMVFPERLLRSYQSIQTMEIR